MAIIMSETQLKTLTKKDRYEELYKNFSWKVPKYYNFGFDVVDQWAEDRTKLALISIDRSGENAHYHTFFDLKVQSNQFVNVLRKIGVKKGDRVLVVLQSIPEWYIAIIGMFKLGVVPMPGTVLLTSKDIEYRVNRAGACMVLTDMDHADRLEVLHTPGHSPGGVSFLHNRMVFGGDTLFQGSIGRTDFRKGSFEDLSKSIKTRLYALPDDTIVYTGHGPVTTIGDEKRYNAFVRA